MFRELILDFVVDQWDADVPLSHEVLLRESNDLTRNDIDALIRASEHAGMMGYGALVAGAKRILEDWEYRYIEFSHEAHANEILCVERNRQEELEEAMAELPETHGILEHQRAYSILRDEARKSEALADRAERYLESKS